MKNKQEKKPQTQFLYCIRVVLSFFLSFFLLIYICKLHRADMNVKRKEKGKEKKKERKKMMGEYSDSIKKNEKFLTTDHTKRN
jgi:hypothetical protein